MKGLIRHSSHYTYDTGVKQMYPSTQLEIIKAVNKNGSTIAKLKTWASIKGLILKGYHVHEISLNGLSGYYLIKRK